MKLNDKPVLEWRGFSLFDWCYLLDHGELTDFERDFVKSVRGLGKLSDKQRPVLLKILQKYFPVTR